MNEKVRRMENWKHATRSLACYDYVPFSIHTVDGW